ncbi:protein-associating with the carboxyl-terminal domain of ezrin [Sarcophilus harrisii]|uniref:SCY1 like pseudokinase 3 n=2 Tax=Sarcophilus harrisii TaxID=9305 RepID=G3WCV6_SARHA|nr:protein-associating with the carboxyl-terminal domain of ezrin [Sarcophilus harrisii]XP_031792718.1 protein-associating with the carboxyl-terminal domain of ezrin [Sarcophilus harrisii]XP_031792719.1 protein-associating with the carboxyl-terminal domain of ezrin [Sarcophilus harrisii]XP_031792720.1 protein-associating with the carboxyl-terminal domain of ezrin [Sarcophilus harrisii]
MGSENSALKSYTLQEPPFSLPAGLVVYPAVLQDGKLASVFVYKRENEDKVNKAAKHLKTLRHPCLLRFLSCTVDTSGIHLVTERVQPLAVALETLSAAELCAGIYDILLALIFLHDRGNLTHNNVCLSSVFVSEDGHWKLGGMETVCKVSEATPEFLRSIQSLRDQTSIPPEEKSAEFRTLQKTNGHARDAYSFGIMVESLLTILSEQVSADSLSGFQQTLSSMLLNPDPEGRPALCTLLSHDFFRNDFLEVVNFLKSLTLKSEEEKTEFFKFLLDRVSGLSEELIASRLVPLLLNQLVFAEPVAVKSFLPHLLGPKKDKQGEKRTGCLLSPALFQTRVIPVLLKLFEVHEEHVRMVLLSHIDAYAKYFTQEQLKKVILPQVLLGLRDTNDSIVAITLHSLAVLVSLLGPEVVVGGERTKIFKRTAPSFTKTVDVSPEGDEAPQPIQLSMNGVPPMRSASGDGTNFASNSKKSGEEWPDWSEPEEPNENQMVSIQVWPVESCDNPRPQFTNLTEEETWDDFEPTDPKASPGNGLSTAKEQKQDPIVLLPDKETETLKVNLPLKADPPGSWDNLKQMKLPQERALKAPSGFGLGEEYTIQVKKKPMQDPELDWFADMIPEIKPSEAFLILPELRTERRVPQDDVLPTLQFSSKFAATEATEGEAEGWGEEEELNWEEDDSSW